MFLVGPNGQLSELTIEILRTENKQPTQNHWLLYVLWAYRTWDRGFRPYRGKYPRPYGRLSGF